MRNPRVSVLGVNMTAIEPDEAATSVMQMAGENAPFGVSALAVHGVMCAHDDAELRHRLNDLEMVVPDGQPVRWAMNWLHRTKIEERTAGPDLMWKLCRRAEEEGFPIFLFGSEAPTLRRLESRLLEAFPRLSLAGVQPSRFRAATEEEAASDVETIRSSGARIVFVGLGCPRQEIWTFENRRELSMPVVAVGAAFDYHAGLLQRAPSWMQRAGLEWAFRLLQDPKRLWRRYLILNPRYVVAVVKQRIGWLRLSPERPPTPVRPS